MTSRNDLASLRLVSKSWNEVATPVLFHALIIQAADECAVYQLDSRPYERLEKESFDCLQLVRHFRIWAPFHDGLEGRCSHNILRMDAEHDLPGGGVKAMSDRLMPLLKQLKPRALRSFWYTSPWRISKLMLTSCSWDLGSCIPEEILGADGYLSREQPELEHLSLNTGTPTDRNWVNGGFYNVKTQAALTLDCFRHLRSFSWTGARMLQELTSLRLLLAANRTILETLELDFIVWHEMRAASGTGTWRVALERDLPGFFTTYVLPLSPDPSINSFPALTTLSLTAVCFPKNPAATFPAFDFGQLRALKLHRCKNAHRLLRTVVEASQALKLESLDLVMDDVAGKEDLGVSSLTAFLQSFNSLRQLYLLITPSGRVTTEQYFHSILFHAVTMKRLVYHDGNYPGQVSIPPSMDGLFPFVPPDYGPSGATHPLMQQLTLESLGCCDSLSRLSELRKDWTPYSSTQSLKLLHIRRSKDNIERSLRDMIVNWTVNGIVEPVVGGKYSAEFIANFELFDFVRWAFGPRGLPMLRILAFGDFSYDGRHKDRCLLFYRQRSSPPHRNLSHGFRLASRDNVISFSGIDKPFDFLSACPKDPLYPR